MRSDQQSVPSANMMRATAFGMITGAVGVMLLNKNNRDRIFSALDTWLKKGDRQVQEMSQQAKSIKEKGRRKLIAGLDKAQTTLENQEDDTMPQ